MRTRAGNTTWAVTTLSTIAGVVRRRVNPQDHPGLPFIGMDNVEAHSMRLLGTVSSLTMKSASVHFRPGDVLYGRLRPYLNKVHAADFEGLASAEFIPLTARDGVVPRFIQYRLNAADFVAYSSQLDEGDRPRVDFHQIGAFEIALPPSGEQHRLVSAIDSYFTRLDDVVATLARVRHNLKRYRASVLKAAVEGRLVPTEAKLARAEGRSYAPASVLLECILAERRRRWEEAELAKMKAKGNPPKDDRWKAKYVEPVTPDAGELPGLPEGWCWASLEQLAVVVRGASPRPAGHPKYFGGSVPWITVGDLTKDNSPYLREVPKTVTEAGRDASRYVEAGTLLLTNSGATLGVPKISMISGCINDGSVALLGVNDPLRLYLLYFLRTRTETLRGINQGAAQPNLNTSIVRAIAVPLPPTGEQIRIIGSIEEQLSAAEAASASTAASLSRTTRSRQSILKWAFEGRLVDQDPTDEPAAHLLQRIRVERESANNQLPRNPRRARARTAKA